MNRNSKKFIDMISIAEDSYQNEVESVLLTYRQQKEQIITESRNFKDENGFVNERLPQAKQSARAELERAERSFREALKTNIAGLKKELSSSINAPIPSEFTARVAFYKSLALAPTRTETEALLTLAGKSPVAVRAVAKLLEDFKAPFRLESRGIDEFENDLSMLDDLVQMPLVHSSYETHSELCDLLVGQPKPIRTPSGYENIGLTWESSVDLLMQGNAVESRLKALETASDAWSADISCTLRERENDALNAEKKAEAEVSGKEFLPEEPQSSTTIKESDDGIGLAAELGRQSRADMSGLAGYMK